MADEDPAAPGGRWRCEYCGCNTNEAQATQCGICSSRRIPSFLRRAGRSAASRLLANHYGIARGDFDDDEMFEEDGLEIQFREGMMGIDDEEQAVAAMAMEVAGVAGEARIPGAHSALSRSRRFQAGPAPDPADRNLPPTLPSETLWRLATENASSYQPKWGTSTQHRGRMRHGHDIEVGSGDLLNVARVEDGVTEGRAVRASEPLPRAAHRSQRDHGDSPGQGERQRKMYGFRVVFEHPYRDPGMSLGDCYLVGVTTSSFSGYGERNGLLQSPHFWGIEDGGSFFEGARRRRGSRPGGPSSSTGYGMETTSRDAPRNADNVLFGSQETVTVVVDLENSTMSFWRDGDFIGTLVRNLPRSGHLYPVVVPFNTGVTFAITGMDGSPLPCVKNFNTSRKERLEQEACRRQKELADLRSVLIHKGNLAPNLIKALKNIFFSYAGKDADASPSEPLLDVPMASRLWYRCGLNLTELCTLIEERAAETIGGSFYDTLINADEFIEFITNVVVPEEAVSAEAHEEAPPTYESGDKVELVGSYVKFGDAADGPLQPGDRGTVLEVKEGPGGETYAVHVSFNASQWWYQPQALLTERSGLIEPPSVWFLHKALRAHGYDQTTLSPLWGKPLSATSWEVGDIVVPLAQKGDTNGGDTSLENRDCFGRIAAESTKDSSFTSRPRGRKSDTVLVEFMDPNFARATGAMNALEDTSELTVQRKRVPVDKLQHASCKLWQLGVFKADCDAIHDSMADTELNSMPSSGRKEGDADPPNSTMGVISSRLRAEIEGVSCLDPLSIQSVSKICAKKPTLCPRVVASGLCDAILSAVSLAEEGATKGKVNDRMGVAVSSLGLLSSILCRGLLAAGNEEPTCNVDDLNALPQQDDDEVNLSALLSEASAPLHDGSAGISDGRRSSDASRPDPFEGLAARRVNPGSIRARGPLFRARARPVNSTSSRCSSEEWNNGDNNPDTRVSICNGLLRNSLPWLKASLRVTQDQSKAKPGSESYLSRMTNARDEHGMSLLVLAITFGCSTDIVRHLILSEANISNTEIRAAAVSNQPHLLTLLLQHYVCTKQVIESLQVSDEVVAIFKDAEARQKIQEEALRKQAEAFVSTLIVSLCRLAQACRSRAAHIQRFGHAVSEALVGNVLLRALHDNQRKALAACSPRRRKHGSSSQVLPDTDSERLSLSLSAPWGTGDSDVFASASAMSPDHGVLLRLPNDFFANGFLNETPEIRQDRVSTLLSFTESLLWSSKADSAAAGLTILHALLHKIPISGLSTEVERYGLRDLMSAHELIAGRRLADIKRRLTNTTGLEANSEAAADSSKSNKKRPRPHLGTHQLSVGDGVVLCPKFHVAVLHLTKHSSFRCDLCGNGVMRDRPMHGCRECDWDACETCTDQAEGGIVKWSHILELSASCRKLLDGSDDARQPRDGGDPMLIDQSFSGDPKGSTFPGFGGLTRKLRLRDETALSEMASKMEVSDGMTNHEFVSIVLPPLHAALVDTHGVTGNDEFCLNAIEALTTKVEPSSPQTQGDDDSHTSVDDIDAATARGHPPIALANRVPSFALQRIQDILSFSENMSVLHVLWGGKENGAPMSGNGTTLKSLTKPIEITMSLWRLPKVASSSMAPGDATVFAEPLLPAAELERHVLCSGRIEDEAYRSFCRSLAAGNTVIVERPTHRRREPAKWRIALVIGFDEDTGAHSLRYPSQPPDVSRFSDKLTSPAVSFENFSFDGQMTMVVLAARNYVILRRTEHKSSPERPMPGERALTYQLGDERGNSSFHLPHVSIPTGVRVESICASNEQPSWLPGTVISRSVHGTDLWYDIVSDDGEVFRNLRLDQIRGYQQGPRADGDRGDHEVYRNLRDSLDPETARNELRARSGALPFPFFRMGRNAPDTRQRPESRPTPESATLKRTWSAISPLNEMTPLEIPPRPFSREDQKAAEKCKGTFKIWECSINGEIVQVSASCDAVEHPPQLIVTFTAHEALSPLPVSDGETTIHLLHRLLQRSDETRNGGGILRKKNRLHYSIQCQNSSGPLRPLDQSESEILRIAAVLNEPTSSERRRKTFAEDSFDTELLGISDGLDSASLQIMEIMDVLASYAEEAGVNSRENRPEVSEDPSERQDRATDLLSSFENESLSQKLRNQLEDPLMVVSGVLPEWCLTAPSLAPRVFSYASRRQLLLRTAFGVSRSTLKQQEAKVAVGALRQRMAVLRGRAVELMGEAFSGDAEDPTVLQLQADELYGMEEALASRVKATFRAQQWEERSLQCAKAVVRREMLLVDATNLMDRYASDDQMCHRRLEVRFEGESGFDAASGTEAGVTRGFYADVAEALLSSEHVSPLNCPVSCLGIACQDANGGQANNVVSSIECRLPLWIPDMDSSHQVVIPTPRASPNSTLGVYPRPLLPYDSLMPFVLERFRFVGRLFAAAMRDGLMFPLQLSTSFLKLVQLSSERSPSVAAAGKSSSDDQVIGANFSEPSLTRTSRSISMTSDDLPRPGFLGGEVYAVEKYICTALDSLDDAQPPLSPMEADEQRQKIASDRQFARVALGKSYSCSFEEYFEDRVFVDPLSPTQGDDAAPLCPNGHLRQVTIHNVREWVYLAKRFILHDGVIEQAKAFRRGVEDFFSSDYLRIFTAVEMQRDVCGGGDKVDRWTEDDIRSLFKYDGGRGVTEALVAVAAMGGEGGASLNRRFGPSSPTIGFLVRTLLESTTTQRRQFLSFVTSVPIATPGKIEVVPMVSPAGEFLAMREGCLPRANTCARRLYLPRFDDYESFNQVLRAVIREESKFKGFYEWRG